MRTDEKLFHPYSNDSQVRTRRSNAQAHNDDYVRVVTPQGGRSIVVWAGFTYDIKIALAVSEGNTPAAKYRDEILLDVW